MTETTEATELTNDLTARLEELSVAAAPKNPDVLSPLRKSWHFLQVYAAWGVRLPATDAMLKMTLGVSDPGTYDFFLPMKSAYGRLNEACSTFLTDVFDKVIAVGNAAERFAKDASTGDGEMFSIISELLEAGDDESTQAAVELLLDLQKQAKKNADDAGKVSTALSAFKTELEDANGDLTTIRAKIEADDRTSQATIDKLGGGEGVVGSLASLRKELEEHRDEYDHDVVVASTTVTYFWVAPPAGLIAAASVAGVYGKRATDMLKQIDEEEEALKNAEDELKTAIAAHKVQDSASNALSEATKYTSLAIVHTTAVQNAWNGIAKNLLTVSDKVKAMTTVGDEGVVVRHRAIIQTYSKHAGKAWAELVAPLHALVDEPYIVVESGEVSWSQFAAQVEAIQQDG